jgi:hypothetical protein
LHPAQAAARSGDTKHDDFLAARSVAEPETVNSLVLSRLGRKLAGKLSTTWDAALMRIFGARND